MTKYLFVVCISTLGFVLGYITKGLFHKQPKKSAMDELEGDKKQASKGEGYKYHLDLDNGGKIECNSKEIYDTIADVARNMEEKGAEWAKYILDNYDVQCYRVNDGWVDREKHIATFFSVDHTKGYYQYYPFLAEGDSIVIGCVSDGGYVAKVTSVKKSERGTIYASFEPTAITVPAMLK